MIHLAHFSDIHIETRSRWRLHDWFDKRLTSWLNLRLLGRGARFAQNERVLAALRHDLHSRNFDRVVFSGDATALGFHEESSLAARLLDVHTLSGLAVPGNHDYCTRDAEASGHFERNFSPWLAGERVEGATYPFAQRVGSAWLIGVSSAVANRLMFDARGEVGAEQLRRLETLLRRLEGGPRILVTHYPVRLANGTPEKPWHALRDLDRVLEVARRGGISLWLHGHRHHPYHHDATADAPFPVICAGSATQHAIWSYGDYTLDDGHLKAVVRVFDDKTGTFVDGTTFTMSY